MEFGFDEVLGLENIYDSVPTSSFDDRIFEADCFNRVMDKNSELREMQALFDRIDSDEEAHKFVKKAINKDMKINSIAELNEVLDTVSLKKANVFFNNVKRIVELSYGEERKTAFS